MDKFANHCEVRVSTTTPPRAHRGRRGREDGKIGEEEAECSKGGETRGEEEFVEEWGGER